MTRPEPLTMHRDAGLDRLMATEWLLTNGIGGFAMGTALGAPGRRYHGLLVASLAPPTSRVLALAQVADTLVLDEGTDDERRIALSTFRFASGALHPDAYARFVRFERDETCVRWVYDVRGVEVQRELRLADDENLASLRWVVRAGLPRCTLRVAPLVALRDFHALLHEQGAPAYEVAADASGVTVRNGVAELRLWTTAGHAERRRVWWRDFAYAAEAERGFDSREDLLCPAEFTLRAQPSPEGAVFGLQAEVEPPAQAPRRTGRAERVRAAVAHVEASATRLAGDARLRALVGAADDFVVRRTSRGGWSTTVLAGYPWFADWGRDAMIALPGLLLTTGRLDDAHAVLEGFAAHVRGGLIPNRFDDYTDEAHYNTADASLWFVHAACALHAIRPVDDAILRACREVVEAHRDGRANDIAMDSSDGLLVAGHPGAQLTWMDAKHGGEVFTPRDGKPVEINGLWINALRALAGAVADGREAASLRGLADRAAASFMAGFWSRERGWLADRLELRGGAWSPVWELRPNQVIACALPHSPVPAEDVRRLLASVEGALLTPFGLRTLDPAHPSFCARYEGGPYERDRAYHNGTAWPWLLGPWVEATLRANGFDAGARAAMRALLAPILDSVVSRGCLGQVDEVYDAVGAPGRPQRGGGCPAQAWSVAELLRVWVMVEGAAGAQ